MQSVQKSFAVAAVGTERLITVNFPIVSVKVNNPSGMWLYIPEAVNTQQEYVPPNTIGWITNILPVASSIHIQYVNALQDGVTSTVTGGPITVTVYGNLLNPNLGTNYTVATQADIAALEAKVDTVISNTNAYIDIDFASFTLVANTPKRVNTGPNSGLDVMIYNPSATDTIYMNIVNDADMSYPMPILPGAYMVVTLAKDSLMDIWLVAAVGIAGVRVMYGFFGT